MKGPENLKRKFGIIVSLPILLGIATISFVCIGLHHHMEWLSYCENNTLPPEMLKFTQEMIYHAYCWMGIALICISMLFACCILYLHHQQKLHPELTDLLVDTQESKLRELKVDIYAHEVSIGGETKTGRPQIITLLDYLLKTPSHEIDPMELNTLYSENFFDGSPSAKRKINNLKFETNNLLKESGFELLWTKGNKLRLRAKTKKTINKSPVPNDAHP